MNKSQEMSVSQHTLAWESQSLSWAAVVLCILLGMWGCLAIYSTQITALRDWNFLSRQIIFLIVGIPVLIGFWRISFRSYREFSVFFAVLAFAAVVGVLKWGNPVNGMSGWFEPFPGIQIQPSEFAKPFYLLLLLTIWQRFSKRGEIAGSLGCLFCALLFAVPVALEPDYGAAVIFLLTMLIFLFISGCGIWKFLLSAAILAVLAIPAIILRWEFVCRRVGAIFRDTDVLGAGWHVQQFQLAIARGGWTGSKLGNTVWTENYLPLAHNDSIFASMSETLGFLGTLPLLLMLLALVCVLIKLALSCSNFCNKIFIGCAAFMIALQALLHISVNATLLPPTGLTLPLISYGGSSLISTMILVGMALSAARHEQCE